MLLIFRILPWDFRVLRRKVVGQASRRLADNLEVAHNSVNGLGVRSKALQIEVAGVLRNPVDRGRNILVS
jgi:hypothetical protein